MGCGGSSPKDETDRIVQHEIDDDRAKDRSVKKLLLLGAGGSGKSTIFKQLQTIHGGGFKDRDRKTFKSQIYEQMIENMKILISKCEEYVDEDPAANEQYRVADDVMGSADFISSTRNGSDLSPEIADHLRVLWKSPAIQAMFAIRNKICVPDSTKHFLDSIDRIVEPAWVPDDKDLMLVRYRTTGMAEKDFVIDGTTFKICDVGGQRNERRKWIHFFDGVTAVIFVAALSSYDEAIFEDETANSMHESLEVFAEHCNSHWFENTAFILFLNKCDLFEEKIKTVPITVCFPEYAGPHSHDDSLEFIKAQFESKNKNPEERQIYNHVTCATNTDNIQKVFNDVQHIVINWSLARSGLL